MPQQLDEQYWSDRYSKDETGWDIGSASPPLMEYCRNLDRDLKILIPGAGNAYELEALIELGFENVTVLDISEVAIERLRHLNPGSHESLVCEDFFQHHGSYDLILEQTFFCALDPSLRPAYVSKMAELLEPDGRLVGVLFNRLFEHDGPPFGGTEQEYRVLFAKNLDLIKMETCRNSISPRAGWELFFITTAKH